MKNREFLRAVFDTLKESRIRKVDYPDFWRRSGREYMIDLPGLGGCPDPCRSMPEFMLTVLGAAGAEEWYLTSSSRPQDRTLARWLNAKTQIDPQMTWQEEGRPSTAGLRELYDLLLRAADYELEAEIRRKFGVDWEVPEPALASALAEQTAAFIMGHLPDHECDLLRLCDLADSDKRETAESYVSVIRDTSEADECAGSPSQGWIEAVRGWLSRKNWSPVTYTTIVVVALALVVLARELLLLSASSSGTSSDMAYTYSYASMPYTRAGSIESASDLSPEGSSDPVVADKAFSIVAFVRNDRDAAARVESVSTEILSLDAVEEPILRPMVTVSGSDVFLFVANDGWGDSPPRTISLFVEPNSSNEMVSASEIGAVSSISGMAPYAPGDFRRVLKCSVDLEGYKSLAKESRGIDDATYYLTICAADEDTGEPIGSWILMYSEKTGFGIDRVRRGGECMYDVTLFGILDVEARQDIIRYVGAEASPQVEETFRVETVIAPTKSCRVECRNVYSVNGNLSETPSCTAEITVPVFEDYALEAQGRLGRELAENPDMDDLQIQQTADRYRYRPESVEEESAGTGMSLGG